MGLYIHGIIKTRFPLLGCLFIRKDTHLGTFLGECAKCNIFLSWVSSVERERERQRERQRDRDRDTETETERGRKKEREGEREEGREREREREGQRETERGYVH